MEMCVVGQLGLVRYWTWMC